MIRMMQTLQVHRTTVAAALLVSITALPLRAQDAPARLKVDLAV